MNSKILFISHTYPPIVGGVENQNYELYTWLSKIAEVKLIANKKRWLIPFFLPYASVRALFSIRKYDAVLLGSGILANVAWLLKLFSNKPIISVAHGLELTWDNYLYQKLWINIFIRKIDKFICVGQETVRIGKEIGIPESKLVFIPNAIDTEKFFNPCAREKLKNIVKIDVIGNKFILTSGRLAKRKGAAWFCRNVMPNLPKNYFYVIAGDGADRENIEAAIKEKNLAGRVMTLGYVTDEVRDTLFNTCDLFVQPNIKTPGDMEGFGISVIEAASCQIPVAASAIEGLKDAIKDGQ
ncbi:MAG TPA: glycosyltransferase family 4 protein, partial [Patescibacteria group bacterium]|nr:glycosyltransferase family 4 protein [Patescibacteria group bacterium]